MAANRPGLQTDADRELRKQLIGHLRGGQAFSPIDLIIEKMPYEKAGIAPHSLPYSFYQQLYHIRVSQYDILEYCRNENYKTPDWPDDYWPRNPAPADEPEWKELIHKYTDEREAFCDYIMDSSNDLFEPFTVNPDHNLLREVQLVIEHTSYHTGQLYIIYRLLNT